jgi:uncharacterized membrane protein YcaP (DUF421 family)
MEAILRAAIMYLVLLVVFRISGNRSLAQITAFDFVLLLVISESTQQALLGEDFSITNGLLVIITMVLLDIGLSLWKQRSRQMDKIIDGVPIILVENGQMLKDRMQKERVDVEDILAAARERQGLERMEQIKYAVLERSGGITIIPAEGAK